MNRMILKEKIIACGKYLFLAGVALLIVRNNSYPFLIKRSSDLLFALSAILALYVAFRFREGYQNFSSNKKITAGILLVSFGLIIASLSGYFFDGASFTKEGILNIGRFAEVFLIIFLVSFFQSFDAGFYKKVALAQFSTLVYLPILLFPHAKFVVAMYRFNFLENWPSNVGYYLIPSLLLLIIFSFEKMYVPKKSFALLYTAIIGLSAIFLWTQTRAAWLGLAMSLFFVVLFLGKNNFKKMAAVAALIIIAFLMGFSVLREPIKNDVLARIFPWASNTSILSNDAEASAKKPSRGLLSDPHRLELWGIYSKGLAERPLGLGINYKPVDTGSGPQGPHNTILEFLVLAGPIGLVGFILLLMAAFKNMFEKTRDASHERKLWLTYVFFSLAGLLIASMFDNMSLFRLIWLFAGMAAYV